MIEDQVLNDILGIELSQECNNASIENSFNNTQNSRESYIFNTVEVPKDYIDKLDKLLQAANITNSIIKSGKINYYTAESLFSIYPFITEAQVNRTTKNMSTINYDSIKKTILENMGAYIESMDIELQTMWGNYNEKHFNIINDGIIERTLNILYAFAIENKDNLEALVDFYYIRKFNITNDNTNKEVYIKFSDLDEDNIKQYEDLLKQDNIFNFIINNYRYYESNQLTFKDLNNRLNWVLDAINTYHNRTNKITNYHYSPNMLVTSMSILYSLSTMTNEDINNLIAIIKDKLNNQYEQLKMKYIAIREDLKMIIGNIKDCVKMEAIKYSVDDFMAMLTQQMEYFENMRFIYNYTTKKTQLLTDIKTTLDNFKKII